MHHHLAQLFILSDQLSNALHHMLQVDARSSAVWPCDLSRIRRDVDAAGARRADECMSQGRIVPRQLGNVSAEQSKYWQDLIGNGEVVELRRVVGTVGGDGDSRCGLRERCRALVSAESSELGLLDQHVRASATRALRP
jgi:hypothetical protein